MLVFSLEVGLNLVGMLGGNVSKGEGCQRLDGVAEAMGGGDVDENSSMVTEDV